MAITRSLILNAVVPGSVEDEKLFVEALERVKTTRVGAIECYVPFETVKDRGAILRDMGFGKRVYLIAGIQKGKKMWLNAQSEEERGKAMDLTKEALEKALEGGFTSFLITSGRNVPEEEKERSLDALEKSIDELYAVSGNDFPIVMEPGDTAVDACQLIGPADLAASFAERIRRNHPCFGLTQDTSHIAQLGEDFDKTFERGSAVSDHLHLASCILKQGHPLYGDKHPLFSNPDGVFTSNDLKKVMEKAVAAYDKAGRDLTVGVEIIDRSGSRMGWLEEAISESPWFF